MKIHEAADIFPLDESSIESLGADIKEHGLLCPIELIDGKILDGRRRFLACKSIGVKPDFVDVKPDDPVAYVLSLNLHRRHLSETQRAMVAARARGIFDAMAKERQIESASKAGKASGASRRGESNVQANLPERSSRQSRDEAAAAVGVGGRTVDYATKVLSKGTPEVIKAVDSDTIKVSTAAKLVDESPAVQRKAVADVAAGKKATKSTVAKANEPEEGKFRGVGVFRANEAIDCLKRIPKNDALRKRGFQIVTDWIKQNK